MRKTINCAATYVILGVLSMASVAVAKVVINTDFAGGNVIVKNNEGDTVQITPDLRGGRPWFYWNFEVTADKPGRVSFKGVQIGNQGPAISLDNGKTWKYAGRDNVKEKTFFYDFTKAGQKVRFAVTIPYVQSNLDAFLKENKGNRHLVKSVLARSKKGRDVELLQIGKPSADKKAILFTSRHHACETTATYLLEGFLKAAISEAPEAIAFRKNYVLYVVPFVDKDGVEAGDQGKNRKPHDHNRDYGPDSIHPEVDAIEKLGAEKNIRFLMDWHCPMLTHRAFHFYGVATTPPNNTANVNAFRAFIDSELPASIPDGPENWTNANAKPNLKMCDKYFSVLPGMIMSTALEVPYSLCDKKMGAASYRLYGEAILRAWTKTDFR